MSWFYASVLLGAVAWAVRGDLRRDAERERDLDARLRALRLRRAERDGLDYLESLLCEWERSE